MKRLIPGARYRLNDHSHDHQDPEMAKAMLIDAGFKKAKLIEVGDTLAARVRYFYPNAPELRQWEDAKK